MLKQTKIYTRTDDGDFFDLVAPMVSIHGKVMADKKERKGFLGIKLDLQDEGRTFISTQTWISRKSSKAWATFLRTQPGGKEYLIEMNAFLKQHNIVVQEILEDIDN